MKKIEAPYLLFALVFGFMALIAPYLMEEHRLTLEGRVAMFLFQAGMVFACSLSSAKHLHDKWVQEEINDRQARLRMPKPQSDDATPDETPDATPDATDVPASLAEPAEAEPEVGAHTRPLASSNGNTASAAPNSDVAVKTPPLRPHSLSP